MVIVIFVSVEANHYISEVQSRMVSLVATKWRMAELMARHRIKNKELADELDIRPNSVTDLKKADTMPRIDGTRLDQIAAAITKLSKIGGIVRGIDLLEDRED